ncbi:MAG: 50S ribosomal protein L32 [Planctomycetota bacterium]
MAVPKRRTSKHRKRIRRSHHHIDPPSLSTCPRCGQPSLPHAVCDACGFYRSVEILHLEG